MPLQQLAPGAVAQLGGARRGLDDVREENSREDPVRLGLPRLLFLNLLQEALQLGEEPVRIAQLRCKIAPRHLRQARPGNVLRQVARVPGVQDIQLGSVHDQGRDTNQRQDIADVYLQVHPEVVNRRTGTDAQSHDSREASPFLLRRTRRAAAKHFGGRFAIAPATSQLVNLPLPLGSRRKPGKLWAANHARRRVDQNQGRRSLRIGGREQRAERPAIAEAADNRTLGPSRVHHRTDVVHPHLERGPDDAVRHACPALVEEEEATQRRQAAEELRLRRILPDELHMVGQARNEDEVELPLPDLLVGDVNVAAERVVGFRCFHRSESDYVGFGPTRFRSTPIPSASSSTTSPGCSQRPSPCSRMQPVPTVPEPITSPGTSCVFAEARSMIASHEWYMSPIFPRERSSPFTRATMSSRRSPSSSGVTTTGPSEVAKSFPLAGPRPTFISLRWRSRADQSFMIVNPPIAPPPPITAATSSS